MPVAAKKGTGEKRNLPWKPSLEQGAIPRFGNHNSPIKES